MANRILRFGAAGLLTMTAAALALWTSEIDHPSVAAGARVAQSGNARPRKVIEFGWDMPDTAFMRRHIARMEQQPFDGCVFQIRRHGADGAEERFTWECWGKRAFTAAELQPALDDLKATRFARFQDNFLRLNVTPGDVDWFEELTPILNNVRLAARVAREGGCKGILFDVEPYAAQIWEYRSRPLARQKSWAEYAAQVRLRGQEVMEAFQEGFPDLTIFLTVGYSHPWDESGRAQRPPPDTTWGLLIPFLDGMVHAARGRTRLVDGHEQAYAWKDTSRFARAYTETRHGLLQVVANPRKYQRLLSIGFGIWMDNSSGGKTGVGWHLDDFSKNYYTPEQFEATVRQALEVSDEYVWIYTQAPQWWTADGPPLDLPPAYAEALRNARAAWTGVP